MIFLFALEGASLTFGQQIEMMLLEKLGVGVIVLSAVVVGQWIIERYKGRRAVWTEISKERVKHIADDWNEMNKWDGIVGDLYSKLQEILEQRLRIERQPGAGKPDLTETIAFLSNLDVSKHPELPKECQSRLEPLIKRSMRQYAVVSHTLQSNRFWLGKEL